MEDSGLMCGYFHITDQGRVAPDAERVVWEAAGADNFLVMVAPAKAGHLGASINAVRPCTCCCVPEMYVPVIRASTSSQQVWLPRAPTQSFDRRAMVCFLKLGCTQRPSIPDRNKIIIAAGGKLGTIRSPFKTADF